MGQGWVWTAGACGWPRAWPPSPLSTADQPRFEHPAAEGRLPVRWNPRRRGPGPHSPQVREPHLHVLPGHVLHRLPHPVAGGAAAAAGVGPPGASLDPAGANPSPAGPLAPRGPAPPTAANLVTVIASSYGRTCTSVCSWSRRNQNRVSLHPGGLRRGGLFVQLLGEPCPASCPLPEACLVEERGDWTSWRLTVMSKGQDHEARGLAPPQWSQEPPAPAKERGWEGERSRPTVSGPSPTEPPPHAPLLAHVPFAFLPSSPDGKSGKAAQWDIVPYPSDHCHLPPLCPIHLLPCCLDCVVGEVGLRDSQSLGGMIRPQLPLTNTSISLHPFPCPPHFCSVHLSWAGSRR